MVSLNRRFNMVFVFVVAVPFILVSLWLSGLYMNALLEVVAGQSRELMDQVARSVENELNAVSVLAATVVYDAELSDASDAWAASRSPSQKLAALKRLSDRLNSIFTFSNRLGVIALYMKDGTVLPVSNYSSARPFVLNDQRAYREARARPNQVVIADDLSGFTDNGGVRFVLSAVICPSPDQGGRAVDAILVMFRVPYLDQFVSFSGAQPGLNQAGLVILDRERKTVLADFTGRLSDDDMASIRSLGLGNSSVKLAGRDYLVDVQTVGTSGWTLLLAADRASLTGRITRYQWYLYPMLALMLGLFFLYSYVLSSRVTKPIHDVVENMRRFASGQEPAPVPHGGIRELAALSGNFDAMVAEVRRLEEERKTQTEQRLAAEIRALQFQINPHFVANTLNSIRMMALAARNDSIRDMTQALIRILADSYAQTSPVTDLASEIENVRSYVAIMKIRFGEHFAVEYDTPPDTLNCRVLRMCLQPLVENAILHGFAGLQRRGLLRLRARRESGELVLSVEDNGVGMDGTRLSSLDEEEEPDTGRHRIGLRNVRDRLRLNFGGASRLTIESRPGEGTAVRIALPEAV